MPQLNSLMIVVIAIAVVFSLASLVAGILCIIRYARTRKIGYLIAGLILTFVLPGLCLCASLLVFIPSAMVVYGPPPTMTP